MSTTSISAVLEGAHGGAPCLECIPVSLNRGVSRRRGGRSALPRRECTRVALSGHVIGPREGRAPSPTTVNTAPLLKVHAIGAGRTAVRPYECRQRGMNIE